MYKGSTEDWFPIEASFAAHVFCMINSAFNLNIGCVRKSVSYLFPRLASSLCNVRSACMAVASCPWATHPRSLGPRSYSLAWLRLLSPPSEEER